MKKNEQIRYIDLFAGIGGFRIALDRLGMKCVFSNDYDKHACITYSANFGEILCKDIHKIKADEIPPFDLLCAGFPCQPFSIAGVSKKNSLGLKHGFDDKKQGDLFFEIMRIVKHHNPSILFLENVKNLKSHDKGNTWRVIKSEIENAGYYVFDKIIDGKYYVPQHRERIYIVCFSKKVYPKIKFEFPDYPQKRIYELKDIILDEVEEKYTLTDRLWTYLQNRKKKNQEKGNGFGFGLINKYNDEYTRTISARYYKDGSEVLIEQANKNPRRLTPKESSLLQGFPENFIIPVSDTQAYRQFGNSVVVPAVFAVAKKIVETIKEYNNNIKNSTLSLFEK
jgi:DNA (cytosine-5)-methyltransferase 1